MTNTEAAAPSTVTVPAPRLSEFDKVAALVAVERVGFYTGVVTDAVNAGLDEGYLSTLVLTAGDPQVAVHLTTAGRSRLAGFRALVAPADGYDD